MTRFFADCGGVTMRTSGEPDRWYHVPSRRRGYVVELLDGANCQRGICVAPGGSTRRSTPERLLEDLRRWHRRDMARMRRADAR